MRLRRVAFSLIELVMVLAIIGILLAILLPAIATARAAMRRTQCGSHLKEIGVAIHSYYGSYQVLPFGAGASDRVQPRLPNRYYSAHSQLLPYLEQAAIFNAINFATPPFAPDPSGTAALSALQGPNATAALTHISVFLCPSDPGSDVMDRQRLHGWGHNNYRSCNGNTWTGLGGGTGLFGQITSTRWADVVDGTSHTAAFSEGLIGDDDRARVSPLTDLFFDGVDHGDQEGLLSWCRSIAPKSIAGLMQDSDSGQNWLEAKLNWTRYNHVELPNRISCKNRGLTEFGALVNASSYHKGGVNVLLADGAVRFVSDDIILEVWRAIGSINGGESVPKDAY